jgi:hypothetical protein
LSEWNRFGARNGRYADLGEEHYSGVEAVKKCHPASALLRGLTTTDYRRQVTTIWLSSGTAVGQLKVTSFCFE